MTAPTARSRPQEQKRLHLVMRDGSLLEGHVHTAEDMSLVTFLGSRKGGWMNMMDARRPKLQEPPGHLIVQADLVVLATAPDHNVNAVSQAVTGQGEREVELHLVGGKRIRGVMYLAPMQRMSDYLHQCGKFAGLSRAVLLPEQAELGEVAVNTAAIATVAEAKVE
ncbi:MAG: hypothetical protein IPJ78_03170 [Gemmatimonadetes bacterium]|jgi:hypothetical protein|nr:hypothetical protein [Gemmatimonadota bacterium]MBP7550489.1 hypothetical protein [Gemmatimonadaceae bacterium]